MLPRYLDVFVLSEAHYYRKTSLLVAVASNRAVREIYKERSSINPIEWMNTFFVDPAVYSRNEHGFDQVRNLIERVRSRYPDVPVVLCSDETTIEHFLAATGDRFTHYFQLHHNRIGSAPDPMVESTINACQVELDKNMRARYKYDIALSFAGEQRELADAIASGLRQHGASVFYDDFEKADLWGRDLYTHLHDVYSNKAQYCILLASSAYAEKVWTNHERQAAQERALYEKGGTYILPVRVDDTSIPGLSRSVAYMEAEDGAAAICDRVFDKIGVVKD